MFNNTQAIRGQTCIVLKRCSSNPQVENSINNQGRTTDQAVVEFKLKVVDEILLEGVTGSIPGNRSDIDRLIARKRSDNDFKVLLVQDTTRFTHAGQGHGQKLLYELRSVGILVYFVAEDLLVDNEMAEMYASFLFSAGRESVKKIAYGATNGSTNSFLDGRSPYSRRPPMGMDRIYSDNGVDRHIIRNMPDGTQEQYDPVTGELTRTFAKNKRRGIPNHYIKQKNEHVRLIPGDPKMIAIIHLIYHLCLVKGMAYHAIAMHLNDSGIPSSQDRAWHTSMVRKILLNPIYIGLAIRNRATRGIYYVSSEGQPQKSEMTLEDLANSKGVKIIPRPRSEWLERSQPHLENFLPEQFREMAKHRIEQNLESVADAKPKKPNRDRHRQSFYLLKGILRSKQGNYLMTGRLSGKPGHEVRKYAVSRGETVPRTNNTLKKRIHGQPLEDAVVAVVREVLLNVPNLHDALANIIQDNMRQVRDDTENPEQLQKEILRKQKQLALLSDDVELEEDGVLTKKAEKIKADLRALKQRQQAVPQPAKRKTLAPDALADEMANEILGYSKVLDQRDNPHIARLLGLLISRMTADLETKEVEIEFSLPSWVGAALHKRGPMGLDELTAYNPLIEAHPENQQIWAQFRCDQVVRPVCYQCKRMKKAA